MPLLVAPLRTIASASVAAASVTVMFTAPFRAAALFAISAPAAAAATMFAAVPVMLYAIDEPSAIVRPDRTTASASVAAPVSVTDWAKLTACAAPAAATLTALSTIA